MSVCKGNILIISRVPSDSLPTIVLNLNLGEHFDRVFKCSSYIVISYQSGQFELCEYQNGDLLRSQPQSQGQQTTHEGKILCVAYSDFLDLIATGSMDGTIKLWTTSMECVIEIIVDSPI